MLDKIKLVQGDNAPDLYLTLSDKTSDTLIDLSSAIVKLKFREQYSTTVKTELLATFPNGGSDGQVKFVWDSTALDTAGNFEGEIEITFPDGKIQTLYDVLKFTVRAQF